MVMLDDKSLELMKTLMEAFGPSGFERDVNAICKEYMEPYADEVMVDKLGSVTFLAKGNDRPRILMAGHTDEVGFIVSSISKEGYLTFNTLGGWWSQVLLGQRVVVRTCKGTVDGIIASKPPHILPPDERKKSPALKSETPSCLGAPSASSRTGGSPWERLSMTA